MKLLTRSSAWQRARRI